ncbi:hypothetical protein [Roseobacter insulae]|nr:hypothetical protein [Roseobacter insulae]
MLALSAFAVAGCAELGANKASDRGIDSKDLLDLQAGIWVDPNGCDHWIIDDGLEGYLSARLDRDTGKPVCSGVAAPTQTTGDFKGGATTIIGDIF